MSRLQIPPVEFTSRAAMSNGRVPAPKPQTTVVLITPEMAKRWLEGNSRNRKISKKTVDAYAADMAAGRWVLTHQGIAFAKDGLLVDGQHRLFAIVMSGVPVEMTVTTGVDSAAIMAIDQNRSRKSFEQFTLMGGLGTVSHHQTATLKAMIFGLSPSRRLTMQEEYALMRAHSDAVAFSLRAMPSNVRHLTTAPVRAAIARSYYAGEEFHEKILQFATGLTSGVCTMPCAETIACLARWLISGTKSRGGDSSRIEVYGKTTRALFGYLHNETLTKLYFPAEELFLLPQGN